MFRPGPYIAGDALLTIAPVLSKRPQTPRRDIQMTINDFHRRRVTIHGSRGSSEAMKPQGVLIAMPRGGANRGPFRLAKGNPYGFCLPGRNQRWRLRVRVEVGDRTRTNPQGALTFAADDWDEGDDLKKQTRKLVRRTGTRRAGRVKIDGQLDLKANRILLGSLTISDGIIADQDISVRSTAGELASPTRNI